MGATGDIEDQPIRRIERDHRRVADRTVGQPFEPHPVSRLIAIDGNQLRNARPRVGQGHAGIEPKRTSRLVDCGQPQRALHLLGEGERGFRR
jgi:hypothetical protein